MTKIQKLNVSLTAAQMRLLKRRAKQAGTSVEAVLLEAVDDVARREAQEKLVASYGAVAELTDDEFLSIKAEWQG